MRVLRVLREPTAPKVRCRALGYADASNNNYQDTATKTPKTNTMSDSDDSSSSSDGARSSRKEAARAAMREEVRLQVRSAMIAERHNIVCAVLHSMHCARARENERWAAHMCRMLPIAVGLVAVFLAVLLGVLHAAHNNNP